MQYNNLSGYLRTKYGKRLKKICIDGGFSCPNRDGKCGRGGCIYCSERGSGEHIEAGQSIRMQVERALSGASSDDRFIVYFQNFTNTYADVDVLKERYDAALIDERIVILDIGTRPDCINEEIAELIASYNERVDVWVELGLQTSSDRTAEIINRGYKTEVYFKAIDVLRRYSIAVITHVMIGLPGEGREELEETIKTLNLANPFGVKVHSVYVPRGTVLEKMYLDGKYTPIEMEKYIERTIYLLTHINPEIVIHRLTGDCPKELLVAPGWNLKKNDVLNSISEKMIAEQLCQGCFYHLDDK